MQEFEKLVEWEARFVLTIAGGRAYKRDTRATWYPGG